MRRGIVGITGEMYTAEEKSQLASGWQYTEVQNFGEFQFNLHGHGFTDEQLTAVTLVFRDGLELGNALGRNELKAELREMLGVASMASGSAS